MLHVKGHIYFLVSYIILFEAFFMLEKNKHICMFLTIADILNQVEWNFKFAFSFTFTYISS